MKVDEEYGERGRNRTYNLLIKSQLLCQLSYAPFEDSAKVGRMVVTTGATFRHTAILRSVNECSTNFLRTSDACTLSRQCRLLNDF